MRWSAVLAGLACLAAAAPAHAATHARAAAVIAAEAPALGVRLGAAPVAAPGAVLNAFDDEAGEVGGAALDVTRVTVASDAAGLLTIHAATPAVPFVRSADFVALFLETDGDPATGSPAADGADYVVVIDGATGTAGLGRWTGFHWDLDVPQATLRAGWDGGPAVQISRAEVGGTSSVGLWLGASWTDKDGTTVTDLAPRQGLWRHELSLAGPYAGPFLPPDALRPIGRALPSAGFAGRGIHLRYRVQDESGGTRERIRVFRAGRVVAVLRTALAPTEPGFVYWATWRAPAPLHGPLRFCITAWDPAGNASRPSCARLSLTPRR
jgi:hypothetical protein